MSAGIKVMAISSMARGSNASADLPLWLAVILLALYVAMIGSILRMPIENWIERKKQERKRKKEKANWDAIVKRLGSQHER